MWNWVILQLVSNVSEVLGSLRSYEVMEVHFFVEQLVCVQESMQGPAAAQAGQISGVNLAKDAMQDLVG